MFNSGIRGKRAADGTGFLSTQEQFVQKTFLIPTITSFSVAGSDDLALDPDGGQTVEINGKGFESGATVVVGGASIAVVTFVDSTKLTFTAPAKSSGSYTVFVTNPNGGTAILTPGLVYSGLPTFTTSAGSLGTYYETTEIDEVIEATEGEDPITYTIVAGSLPTGATLNSAGYITGTSPVDESSNTYTFTVQATDAENQDSTREFSLTINVDVVTWVTPAEGTVTLDGNQEMSNVTLLATSAAGYDITYTANTLPNGVSLSGNTVFGTPDTVETVVTEFTATANTTNRSATRTVTWVVILGDVFFNQTSLVLTSNDNTFITDASDNLLTLTPNGDTRPSAFSPYNGGWSNFFGGGSAASIGLLVSSNPISSTGAFWVEAWVYATNPYVNGEVIFGQYSGGAGGRMLLWIQNSKLAFSQASASWYDTTDFPTNQWVHVAVGRDSSNNMYMYRDGILVNKWVRDTAWYTGLTTIGYGNGLTASELSGYISNLRVLNQDILHSGAAYSVGDQVFAPPTEPLTVIDNTTLLTCQSNRFVDESNNFTFTINGDVRVTNFSPFTDTDTSTGSGYFDGTGDYLSVPQNSAFNLGTGAFSVEGWFYVNAFSTSNRIIGLGLGAAGGASKRYTGWTAGYNSSSINFYRYDGSEINRSASVTLKTGQWYHYVACRDTSSNFALFLNGTRVLSQANATTAYNNVNSDALDIAKIEDSDPPTAKYANAYFSNIRVIAGTTAYDPTSSTITVPTAPLTAVANTQLLTLQNRIGYNNSQPIDESGIKNVITRGGNASVGSYSPYVPTGWSGYFDGTGDYLSEAGSSGQYAFGTGNFTVEFWMYALSATARQGLYTNNTSSNGTGPVFAIRGQSTTGVLGVGNVGSADTLQTGSNAFQVNTWHHIALVREGTGANQAKIYVDGVEKAVGTLSDNYSVSRAINIGATVYYNENFNGYLSNFRVIKGTALYTSNFTPSTEPLEPIANTSLLTLRNPSFVDDGPNRFAITRNGDTKITPFSPFKPHTVASDSYSVYFDGTGDSLNIASNPAFALGTGDFELSFWLYPTSTTQRNITFPTVGAPIFYMNSSRQLQFENYGAPPSITTTNTLSLNSWNHCVASRVSGTTRLFINGVEGASSDSFSSTNFVQSQVNIGVDLSTTYCNGYMSDVRIVKGFGVTSVTVPTEPLTAISGTSLLTCQSPTVIDNSTNDFAITVNGNSQPTKFNPFGETVTSGVEYSPASHGGSVYFDGTGDYLSLYDPIYQNSLGSGDWTFDCWMYFNSLPTGSAPSVVTALYHLKNDAALATTVFILEVTSGGAVSLSTGTALIASGTAGKITTGSWIHFACVRTNGVLKTFFNGVQDISVANTTTYNGTYVQLGAWRYNTYNSSMNGYVSNLRIVKGTALYTSAFVPPQAPVDPVPGTTLLTCDNNAAIQDKTGRNVLETVGNARTLPESPYRLNKSVYFDGTGDYLSLPNDVAFTLGTDAFTLETWVYLTAVGREHSVFEFRKTSAGEPASFFITTSDTLATWTGTLHGGTGTALTIGTWNHIVWVRDSSSTFSAFLNGNRVWTIPSWTINIARDSLRIAGSFQGLTTLQGYLSNSRVVKGTAIYDPTQTTITVPTSPLTAVSGTQLLTCQSYNFKDNSSNDFTITRNGDAKITSFGPFTETQTSDNAMYFDGTGDYLVTNGDTSQFAFGTGDFTIEFWLQSFDMGASVDKALIDFRPSGPTNGAYPYLYIYQSKIRYYFQTADRITQSDTLTLGSWHHVALTREGTSTKLFVDGVEKGSYTNGDSCSVGSQRPVIGCNTGLGANFNGYIDDLRITKGVARTITVPTSTYKLK